MKRQNVCSFFLPNKQKFFRQADSLALFNMPESCWFGMWIAVLGFCSLYNTCSCKVSLLRALYLLKKKCFNLEFYNWYFSLGAQVHGCCEYFSVWFYHSTSRQNTHNFIWIDAEHLIGIGIQLRFKWQLKNREYLVSWMPYSLAYAELLLLEFLCIFCIRGWMVWVWGFSLPLTFTLLPSCVLLGFVTVWKLLAIPVSLSSGNL